jgi:PPOX class probable F420-dependent enzyme
MLDHDVRGLLDGTPIAHLATILPDGSPHSVPLWIGTHGDYVAIMTGRGSLKARNLRRDPRVAISLTPPGAPFPPVMLRGRVLAWLEGDGGWAAVDQIAIKYTREPYGRDRERIVALIEIDYQRVGLG